MVGMKMDAILKKINISCQMVSVILTSLETLLVLQSTWFTAYFNGVSTGTYRVIVYINNMGEANVELVMWCIMTPIIIYGTYLNLKLLINKLNEGV